MACESALKRTSNFLTTSRPRDTPVPRASDSTALSSSWRKAPAISKTRISQYEIYRGMLEGMAPGPVTVRTFDVDEDQLAAKLTSDPREAGWVPDEQRGSRQGLRGLRLSLTRPEVFRVQLRALLRAAKHGRLRIMFPFVSSVEQLREAKAMVAAAAEDVSVAAKPCRMCRSE